MRIPAPFHFDLWRLRACRDAVLARLYVEWKLGRAMTEHEWMMFRLPILTRSKP
jgi:hypothetical protein